MIDFIMPSLGSDMDEGTLNEWLIKPGDKVGFALAQAPLHIFDADGQRLNAPVEG